MSELIRSVIASFIVVLFLNQSFIHQASTVVCYLFIWNSRPKQLRQPTSHQPSINETNQLHSASIFVTVPGNTQNVPLQPIIPSLVCIHYRLCQFSGFLTRRCSSSHNHFHCYNSPSHHSLPVCENKPLSVIVVLVGLFAGTLNPHSFSFIFHSMLGNYYHYYNCYYYFYYYVKFMAGVMSV